MKQWVISYGTSINTFFTDYHARQFQEALRMNGTDFDTKVWLKLADSLTRSEAERFATKVNREDAKLRKLGGTGNNTQVKVREDFNRLGRQQYAVWVVRAYALDGSMYAD